MATLYRGDVAPVERFQCTKTYDHNLFGKGIYLTSSREVAIDYTKKSPDAIAWHDENAGSPRELIASYLKHIAVKELDWETTRREIRDKWQGKLFEIRDPKKRDDAFKDFEVAYKDELRAEASKVLKKAKAIFKEHRNELSLMQDTLGHYYLLYRHQNPRLSCFKVPDGYLTRMLHGDRPLSEDALNVVRAFVREQIGDRKADFRDKDENFLTFDDFIEIYKTEGTRYAWTEKFFGGEGENPSLDIILNGTHSGFGMLYSNQDRFREMLQKAGYVGIQYDGGIRLAGTGPRGGGGVLHDAYIFWDDDAVNSFRIDDEPILRPAIEDPIEKGLRAETVGLSSRG